jgi:hypothetical protein
MSNIDRYTKFIAEQVRKGSVTGLRSESTQTINEGNEYWSHDPDTDKVKKHPNLQAAKKHVDKLNSNEDREQSAAVHEIKPHADGKRGTIVKTHENPDEGEWHTHTDDKGSELKL